MIVDIDVGNTQLKWVLRDQRQAVVGRGQFLQQAWPDEPLSIDEAVTRVRIASVQGERNSALAALSMARWGVEAEFATVEAEVAGLRCGYEQPAKLGIDRWLAVLACWQTRAKQALVVDAGSALTMDVLDGSCHRGGYIAPGLQLMQRALAGATWGVRGPVASVSSVTPGRGTSQGVAAGCLAMAVGAVQQAAAKAGLSKIVLTGGDAEQIAPCLDEQLDVVVVPDLVLDGLAIALP